MYRRPPESTRTDPLLPYTPRFRSLLIPPGAENSVRLGWQGCADAGLCYPPQTREVSLTGNGTAAAPGLAEDQALVSGLESQALAWSLLVRSEEHTSELQSLMRISYAVLCLKTKKHRNEYTRR